jgi:hypothetical protein
MNYLINIHENKNAQILWLNHFPSNRYDATSIESSQDEPYDNLLNFESFNTMLFQNELLQQDEP